MRITIAVLGLCLGFADVPVMVQQAGADFTRLEYRNPGLVVDLGVGLWAWPLPMDYDGDGDLDLVVSCPDVPSNGTYFFENPGGKSKMPVFKSGVRIDRGRSNVSPSYVEGRTRVLIPGHELRIDKGHFGKQRKIYPRDRVHKTKGRTRARQWKYVDYDGDGTFDLVVGVGDWTAYGWDNAFNAKGKWTRGPLHGYVYWLRNIGSTKQPKYALPKKVLAGGKAVDVFGMPSPNFADFDGDGDLDLLCGEFVDGFTYFRNTGSRTKPVYDAGTRLPVVMDLCMIVPVAVDWDKDGDVDLIVGQEDGRVAFIEHTGKIDKGLPVFAAPKFFQQQAKYVMFGALITPVSFDWDGDGDEDIIAGNTAGHIGFIENLDGGNPPKWAAPVRLKADSKTIQIQAGINGSIQGPCERKWGYTTVSVADWDHDKRPDIIANSIWGKVVWYRNVGTRTNPKLAAAAPLEVQWRSQPPHPSWNWWRPHGKELVTQWRTSPVVIDWNHDGFNDLVMLDHEGYLALFRRAKRNGQLVLLPGERICRGGTHNRDGKRLSKKTDPLRLNNGFAGRSGRRQFCIVDWDGDGKRDLLLNSRNANFMRQVSSPRGVWTFEDKGALSKRRLAGHGTKPTTVDWDGDGVRDLLLGAEDGFLYYLRNPRKKAS